MVVSTRPSLAERVVGEDIVRKRKRKRGDGWNGDATRGIVTVRQPVTTKVYEHKIQPYKKNVHVIQ